MSDKDTRLPAVIVTGMNRKIKEAYRNKVDGHPASLGMPMEYEVKHYYNYFLSHKNITFEIFTSLLAEELTRTFPRLDFTFAWVRQCDALGNVRSARRCLHNLQAYVSSNGLYSVSFWDLLWRLKEIYVKSFGMTYREIGTTRQEIERLSWQFLLKECSFRVKQLRQEAQCPASTATREAFMIVDKMLTGIPLPSEIFCKNRRTHYSSGGPYQLYRQTAEGRIIQPEDVNWSLSEHHALKRMIFPEGYPETEPLTDMPDPTAPATAAVQEREVMRISPLDLSGVQIISTSRRRAQRRAKRREAWSKVVRHTMRKLPHAPRYAAQVS